MSPRASTRNIIVRVLFFILLVASTAPTRAASIVWSWFSFPLSLKVIAPKQSHSKMADWDDLNVEVALLSLAGGGQLDPRVASLDDIRLFPSLQDHLGSIHFQLGSSGGSGFKTYIETLGYQSLSGRALEASPSVVQAAGDRADFQTFAASFPQEGSSASFVWDGEGSDGDFSNPINWNGNAEIPANGDILQIGPNLGSSPILALNTPLGPFSTPSFTFLANVTSAYTVTAASFSDGLILTGPGVTLQNVSPIRQTFSLVTITLNGSQTWDAGAAGLRLAQVDLGHNNTLTITGTGIVSGDRIEALGGFTGTGTSGIIKQGGGTLVFGSSILSDYTGSTTISDGILQLNANNQIPDGSKLILNGGTFYSAGFDDKLGSMLLTADSTIDFGLGADLIFAFSASEVWGEFKLTILNFDAGQNTWRVGTDSSGLTSQQLSRIFFNGTIPAQIGATGYVIPEVSSFAALLFGVAVVFGRRRKRYAHHPDFS